MLLSVVLLFGCTDETLVSPDSQPAIAPASLEPAAAVVPAEVPFKGLCILKLVMVEPVFATVSGHGTLIGHFTGTVYGNGTVVLRAPDGSELHADVSAMPVIVTGGTGRFENATGQWVSTPIEATPDGWIETFEGKISSVGSNQK